MKIIKIHKKCKNIIKEHFLVLLDEPYSYDDIVSNVEDWCETEPSGMNSGYTYEWWFIEDTNTINIIIKDQIKNIKSEIKILKNKKYRLKMYLTNK